MRKKFLKSILGNSYLAIIIWVLWMLFITFTVYFIESSLLFVFVVVGSCLLDFSIDRLVKKARLKVKT